jgi:crossover junction endodeoxyribonuclease RuvC
MKVLGIDPGTAVLGFGVVDGQPGGARLVECGVLVTKARDPLPRRLRLIHEGVTELLVRHRPDAIAVESVFYGRNARTTMVMSHARGVILLAGEEAGVPLAEYSPAMVKKTVVGRGAALKPQVGYMVAQLLRLRAPPTPHDAADGVALALTHVLRSHRPALRALAR